MGGFLSETSGPLAVGGGSGAYAKRPFLQRAKELGITVVSRLRKDAALLSLPKPKSRASAAPRPAFSAPAATWQKCLKILSGFAYLRAK